MPPNFDETLQSLKEQGLYRFLKTVESDQGSEVIFEGKKYLNFSSNNYLGLANHPVLVEASIAATKKYGTGSGASRLITGSMSLHRELEEALARFKGCEAALLFNSGYHANMGVVPTLAGEGSLIFSDELNHASLIDGCRLAKGKTVVYRHGDMGRLEELLADRRSQFADRELLSPMDDPRSTIHDPRKLIITDSLFSMDGDLAKLPEILKLAEKYDAMVFVDEAHATGVLGEKGRGAVEYFGIPSAHPRLIQMGTLGKALGSFGAYVCGSLALIETLINKARPFIFTTALPPGVAASALAAVRLISEDTSLKKQLWENVNYFVDRGSWIVDRNPPFQRSAISDQRLAPTPIIPIIIGDSQKTMEVSDKLFEKGIWVQGIRPPTVPEGTSRLRLTIMATHTREHLDRCLEALHDSLTL